MVTSIQKWLDITTTHTYFPNNVCDVLQFIPTAETAASMKRYGILIRPFSNILSFYCTLDASANTTPAQQISGMPDLCFQVLGSNYFMNYSDLPLSLTGISNQFLFTNGIDKKNPNALQSGAFVSAADLITLQPLKFQLPIPAVSKVTLTVTDSTGQKVLTQQADGTQTHLMNVNLAPFGTGQYQLKLQKDSSTIFASSAVIQSNSIGILQLKTADLLTMLQSTDPIHLTLAFNARSAFWKYAIVIGADKQIDVQSMTVESTSGVAFTGPVSEPIPGGAVASVYTSPESLPLQSALPSGQLLKVSYKNRFSERVVELDQPLPAPDISRLTVVQAPKRGPTFYTSRIINV